MTFTKCNALALAALTVALAGCNDSTASNARAASPAENAPAYKQISLLQDRLPATCFVRDSENLAFCMPGDTLIYEPNPEKEEQAKINDVIGGFCDVSKPLHVNGESLICSFHQNRTYNANPVNQQAIVASNIQVGRDYLAQVAQYEGIKELAPGLYVLPLKSAAKDAPSVTADVAVQLETKLLTPDLRVHSYMLDDMVTLDGLAPGNPFAQVFPTLKKGDVVRVYIDFAHYPNVWNVDSSLQGLPYIWEVNVMDVRDKPVVQQPAPAPTPAPAPAPAEGR